MKSFVVIFFLALGIQGSMSENDIGGNGCIVPAICKTPGYVETVWMSIARPVCEAGFGMERTNSEVDFRGENGPTGPQGEDGQHGEIGQPGSKGDKGTRGENGNTGEGAKGAKGIKGRFGPKGESGSGNSLVFRSIINVRCPVKHGNKCFFPVLGRAVDYDGGVAICENLGGHLANIYSQIHMDDVMKYIRENRMGDDSTGMWFRLGMKYDPKAKNFTLRDGTDAPAGLKWRPGFPFTVKMRASNADRTNVMLSVVRDQSSIYKYLHNESPTAKTYFLCEIE